MMYTHIPRWLRLLLGGAVLFGAQFSGCFAEALRETSEILGSAADDIDDEDDWDDILEDIEDWFD